MKVRAIRDGFHDKQRRRVGDVFEISGIKELNSHWLELVEEQAPPAKKPKPKQPERELDAEQGTGNEEVI